MTTPTDRRWNRTARPRPIEWSDHRPPRWLRRIGGAIALLALVAGGAAWAEDGEARGLALAATGSCDEAVAALEPVHAADPANVDAALADAQCRIRLRRYAEAVALLRALRERAPGVPEIDLYLAIGAYHLGDGVTSERALARALERLPRRGEAQLYHGILALERGEVAIALRALDTARALDGERVEPMASYYAGVAHTRLRQPDDARDDLEWVMARDPGSAWADRARRLIEQLDEVSGRDWRIRTTVGFEHDDNVVLRGDDVTLPEEISDAGDVRAMWLLEGSGEVLRGGFGSLGLSASYAGTAHQDLGPYDTQYPGLALWWNRPVAERSLAWMEYRFGYAWVDGDPFVTTHSFGPAFVHGWEAGRTTARVRGFAFDYHDELDDVLDGAGAPGDPCPGGASVCGPPGVDESERRARTGLGYEMLVDHRYRVPWIERELELTPGVRFQQYFADGAEVDYLRVGPHLDTRVELPWLAFASTSLSYDYRPFRSGSSLPDPDSLVAGVQFAPTGRTRRDHVTRASVGLERSFLGVFVAEARYAFTHNDSNDPSADYDRHIVGGYLTVELGDRRKSASRAQAARPRR